MLPQIAQGEANKVWIVPSELTSALSAVSGALGVDAPAAPEPPRVAPAPAPSKATAKRISAT